MKLDRSDMFVVDGIRRTGLYHKIKRADFLKPIENIEAWHLYYGVSNLISPAFSLINMLNEPRGSVFHLAMEPGLARETDMATPWYDGPEYDSVRTACNVSKGDHPARKRLPAPAHSLITRRGKMFLLSQRQGVR